MKIFVCELFFSVCERGRGDFCWLAVELYWVWVLPVALQGWPWFCVDLQTRIQSYCKPEPQEAEDQSDHVLPWACLKHHHCFFLEAILLMRCVRLLLVHHVLLFSPMCLQSCRANAVALLWLTGVFLLFGLIGLAILVFFTVSCFIVLWYIFSI